MINEEKKFSILNVRKTSKENNSDLYVIIDKDKFIRMCYIVNRDNVYYFMYLAVEPSIRDKSYCSKILMYLGEK